MYGTSIGRSGVCAALVSCGLSYAAAGAEPGSPPQKFVGEAPACPPCEFGGDIRIREVYFDDIPIKADPPGVTRGGANHFFRFRTRLWGQWNPSETVSLRGRLVNEFRHYEQPTRDGTGHSDWNAPDEVIVDNLYLDLRELFGDTLDLRIGRQDLIYGTGKLMLEGTPKDGSRTIYMDAVRATFRGLEKQKIDVFGIYNQPENEWALNSQDRDLTGLARGYNDMTEKGGGVYWNSTSLQAMPADLYYMYKVETAWDQGAGDSLVRHDELDLHTVGTRLMPKFTDTLRGSFEGAWQTGERGAQDVEGYGFDALLTWSLPAAEALKPSFSAGWYYLSGDDPATEKDEGWNPLWARWPQYSELYIYAYDADAAGRWSNLSMPHVDLAVKPASWCTTTAMVGWMFAPEKNGPGGGDERGLLFTLRNDFTLAKAIFGSKDKLTGHVLLELLEPGDYYDVDSTAVFARWELNYAF